MKELRGRIWTAALLVAVVLTGCDIKGVPRFELESPGTEQGAQESGQAENASQALEEHDGWASGDLFAMDTYMTVSAYGSGASKAVEACASEIRRLDALLSTGDKSSEVYGLNHSGGGILSEDTAYLYERSVEIGESTGGCFNPAIYPVMEAWGFTDSSFHVPDEKSLAEALQLADPQKISYDPVTHRLDFQKEGMAVDFGGIAKGYTSARIMELFQENGVDSGMVSLGGNVQVYRAKPDGSDWRVAIRSPESSDEYLGILRVQDTAVITSGGYERYFEEDGRTYHHIIDPADGYPADSGLVSVTIVCKDGTLADGLSTALFIMGAKKGIAYWRDHSGEFDAVLLSEDGTLYVTEGIRDAFISERSVTVVKRSG